MEAGGSPGGNGRGDLGTTLAPAPAEIEGLVRSLVGMMRGGSITELDVAFGSVSIRLRGQSAAGAGATVAPTPSVAPTVPVDSAAAEHVIAAPMIGTFYVAPTPGDPPYVEVGDPVEVGQVVGVIEAMKIMNEIVTDAAGVVTAILVANAQPVEYGSPLIRLGAPA